MAMALSSADWPPFRQPPIQEALLIIKVVLKEAVNMQRLGSFQEIVRDRFPSRRLRTLSKRPELHSAPERTAPESPETVGYVFTSPEGDRVVQVRLDGFAFNKLKPYENWAAFRAEAAELWELYKRIVQPEEVTGLTLRYINRIEVPFDDPNTPRVDLEEYLRTAPVIAPELPQSLSTFFLRLVLPRLEDRAVATVIQAIERTSTPTHFMPLLFDIQVARSDHFPLDSSDIWLVFERLREIKNEIFFYSLTEKARKLFNE
jgi:uncharacterized protein (TIGR04255 family)